MKGDLRLTKRMIEGWCEPDDIPSQRPPVNMNKSNKRRTHCSIVRLFFMFPFCLWIGGCGLKPAPKYTTGSQARTGATQSRMMTVMKAYMGVPYLYGGDNRRGIDCSGLVMVVYRQATGLNLPHRAARLKEMGQGVSRTSLRFGDLVFFNTGSREGLHTGIYIGDSRFVHASVSRGVIVSHLDESYYNTRYIGARRLLKR